MAKRGGTIVFDEEVRKPRERIRDHERRKNEPRAAQENRYKQKRPATKRSDGVKDASQRFAMRENIVGPEIRERARVLHRAILAQSVLRTIRKITSTVAA